MKKTTLLVGAFLCAICSFAQGEYPINWDKDTNLATTRADRVLQSVTFSVEGADSQVAEVGKTGVVYNDLSNLKFNAKPGETASINVAYKNAEGEDAPWMHTYVYVDVNNDGQFEWNDVTPGKPGSELLSYAFWSGNINNENYGYDSNNTYKSGGDRSKVQAPAFVVPSTPGEYRMRVKIDWNCIDPAGQYGSNYSGNFINANGGYIVDVTLNVEGNVEPEPFVPAEYGPVLLSEGDNLVCFKIHNLGAADGNYKGNDCYVKYVAESAGTWNSLFHTETADDADNFAFFAAEDGGVYIKDVTANKFVTWKQNAEGGINWGAHQLTACQVTLVDAMADAKSWFIVDDENTEGRYDILPLATANNGWSFMGGIDQDFVVLNLEKKTDRNIKWVFEQVEGETPVDPEPPVVEPEELTWSAPEANGIYAIVNLQPTGNNFYLDYLDGNLSPVSAADCNSLFEWPETAKFQAVKLADGRFAFKNCGTGNYLAWRGQAHRADTTGANENKGYTTEINEHSSWTMHDSERYEGAYWFRVESRNDVANNGLTTTGTLIIDNNGGWNAWTTGEYAVSNGTGFSNSFGFYLIEMPEAPAFDYAAAIAPVLAEANAALEGHDHVYNYTYSDALLTKASQFSSPFSQNDLGAKDGQNLSDGCLIDNNNNTFWHSVWSQGNKPAHSHYLQVELDEAIDGDLVLTFVRRNADNDQVTRFDVESSMDGVNYSHAAYIDMPNSGKGKTETKEFALEQKAQYLRFWADATTNNRGYWHCAEFQLKQKFSELLVDAPDYAYPSAVADLQEAIAATPTANGTQEDVDALAAAIEAYKAALAGYPEFTEWTGEFAINAGEVKTIDDLLNVDLCFSRAAEIERGYSVLGAIFDQTGDAYALVLDGFCGDVDYKTVKNDEFIGKVASVEFKKISEFVGEIQGQAKAAAAKIGAFQPEAGHAYVLIASKSFLVDGERFNEFKKFDCTLATGTITGVETIVVPANDVIFDLQGRRTNATTGLRIQNGRVVR